MLNALTEVQRREGLSDGAMAHRLGCHRSYWNLIRNGKRPLTHEIAVRAAGTWPELTRHLLDMAEESVMSVANSPRTAA